MFTDRIIHASDVPALTEEENSILNKRKGAASAILTAPSVRPFCKLPNVLRPHNSVVDPHVVDHAGEETHHHSF